MRCGGNARVPNGPNGAVRLSPAKSQTQTCALMRSFSKSTTSVDRALRLEVEVRRCFGRYERFFLYTENLETMLL